MVLYNGAAPWTAAAEVGDLVVPVGPSLAPYQPSQRYLVLDERHVEADDLPSHNLMTAVVRLEQSRSPGDLMRVVDSLREWQRSPRDDELMRTFTDWVRWTAERVVPRGEELPPAHTLEELRMSLIERASRWPAQWMEEGREQGLKHERALLRRMTASRFGVAVA